MDRREKKSNIILGIFITLIIFQIGFFVYNQYEIKKISNSLLDLEEKFERNFQEMNSNINILSSKVIETENSLNKTQESLLNTQEDLEKEISSLKASASSDFSGVIENSIESVVSIKTNIAQGTGFIIDEEGYIVTNYHVLDGATSAAAITADQKQHQLTLIDYDENLDLALLKMSGTYSALAFADSEEVKVGEKVIAIGNPYGLSFSVTEGIISAVHRKVSGYSGEYFQTDAALNSGNSGGPLINKEGKVIGINNFKVEGDNIGLALESNMVIEKVNEFSESNLNFTLI